MRAASLVLTPEPQDIVLDDHAGSLKELILNLTLEMANLKNEVRQLREANATASNALRNIEQANIALSNSLANVTSRVNSLPCVPFWQNVTLNDTTTLFNTSLAHRFKPDSVSSSWYYPTVGAQYLIFLPSTTNQQYISSIEYNNKAIYTARRNGDFATIEVASYGVVIAIQKLTCP